MSVASSGRHNFTSWRIRSLQRLRALFLHGKRLCSLDGVSSGPEQRGQRDDSDGAHRSQINIRHCAQCRQDAACVQVSESSIATGLPPGIIEIEMSREQPGQRATDIRVCLTNVDCNFAARFLAVQKNGRQFALHGPDRATASSTGQSETADPPEPLRPIIEALPEGASLYVRKSVANNLDDITKVDLDWVMQFLATGGCPKGQRRLPQSAVVGEAAKP